MHTITNTFLGRPALMQAYVDQILDPIYSGATTGKRKESTATTSSLLQHWEMFGAKKQRYSPGYSLQAIARMKRAPFAFQHNGCVNACQFNAQGTVMLSGSDDLAIKVWRSSTFLDPKEIALASTLHTQHTHNIFHLEFAPNNDHRIFSGAADGELRMYDLNASAGAGVSEVRLQYFAHKMVNHFCFTDPNTVYTAAFGRDGGCVRGVDLRSPGGIQNTIDVLECPSLPVKQVATCPWNLNTLAVGVGSEVRFCDLRKPPAANDFATVWTLQGVFKAEQCVRQAVGTFLPGIGKMDVGGLKLARTLLRAGQIDFSRSDLEVSVSSLQFSSQSREVLVSYQKDRIYRFPCGQEHEGNAEPIPTQTFCGAINEHTFLKRAVYFGPQEEYVVCGGDGGSLFVFASQSGELVNTFSRADSGGVVNGVVPNPAMQCCLVSYGLDSDAKLWTVGDREEDEGEVGNEISRGSAPHQAKIFHVLIQARDTVLDTRRRQYFEDDPYQTMLSYGVRLARMLEQQQPQRGPSRSLVLAARDSGKSESLATSRGRFEYCLQAMEKLRTRGNELFRAFQFQEALDLFAVAVQYALGACALFAMTVSSNDPRVAKMGLHAVDDEDDDDEEEEEEDGDLKVNRKTFDEIWGLLEIASTNAAECALKLVPTTQTAAHHFAGEALLFSDQALLANPQSLKARYRRYRALTYLGKRAEAGLEMDRIKALPNGATWIKKLKI